MPKQFHEIRDPIHVFIQVDNHERRILDSEPLQRLRHVHQLALSFLVYPGATHRRFEHALGTMELAGRVFDVLVRTLRPDVKEVLDGLANQDESRYWRRCLRMAALCHDIGHLPFSHAAEHELLPLGWDHERLTRELIQSSVMMPIWSEMKPPLDATDVVRLAVGKKKANDLAFTPLHEVLAEIIVGDAFGVDRMDYLLRDSHHAGVMYGKFDHYRLIDTLRILPTPETDVPTLGIEEGGLLSAEALLLARYYMFSQVYFHDIRQIYDIHLREFLLDWLPGGKFPVDWRKHLEITDNEVFYAMRRAASKASAKGHESAKTIMGRDHYKQVWSRNPADVSKNPDAGQAVVEALRAKFPGGAFRHARSIKPAAAENFPVVLDDGRVEPSSTLSSTIQNLQDIAAEYVFSQPSLAEKARKFIKENRASIFAASTGGE